MQKSNIRRILLILPLIIASSAIFYMSHQPNIQLPDVGFDFLDKLLHAGAYFVYGMAVIWAFIAIFRNKSNRYIAIASFIFANLFAISDEIHQHFVVNRFMDFGDWVADCVGIFFAVLLTAFARKVLVRFMG
jgi:VanZ family protein